MPHRKIVTKALPVPTSRLSRLAKLGGLASSIAGNVATEAARQLARGQRPRMEDLLLTPANAMKVADKLARMRGAAMKVGQLMSMDAGDVLPPELAQILARLRADAHHMPWLQLKRVLTRAWGAGWRSRFETFDVDPIAAASIGQVHRARTKDGRDLAIKVQYPGIRHSIDSDVDNVAALMRVAGTDVRGAWTSPPCWPRPSASCTRRPTTSARAAASSQFGALLADRPEFRVPELHPDLTTPDVLAMSYVEGRPVDDLASASQAERNRVMTLLIDLLFRELFEFRLMQTDPNFANYRYVPATGQVILLDFGATRAFPDDFADHYRRLMRAGLEGDRDGMRAASRADRLSGRRHARAAGAGHARHVRDVARTAAAGCALRLRRLGPGDADARVGHGHGRGSSGMSASRRWTRCSCSASSAASTCWPRGMRAQVNLRALIEQHL